MKKVVLVFSFFVIILSIFFIKMQAVSYSPEKVLEEAFDSSGAARVSSELYLRGRLGRNAGTDIDSCRRLAGDVLKDLGAGGAKPDYNTVDRDGSRGVELDCSLGGGRSMHASIVTEEADGDTGSGYIAISLVNTSKARDLAETRKALEKSLNAHGIRPRVNSCITGCFDGKTDDRELNAACARIFASAGARKVEGIREGSLISVSAFSSAIRESVNDNGSKVNLNLAVRYNSYENKTYIWLATPVITTEY